MVTLIAPASAQAVLIAVMAIEGRWLFVAMIVPGLIGCLASLILALVRNRQERRDRSLTLSQSQNASLNHEETSDADIAVITPCPLEVLLGVCNDRFPWRTVAAEWLNTSAAPTLRVPLGMSVQGPFMVDLASQGPHALVAGTTGSGKSVLLQAWCLALAIRNPPDAVHFVFLDFKGGAAFNRLEALPHTVGSVCDLDLAHAMRALRALEGELTRREQCVAQARVSSVDMLDDPPARLIVVIDEFHALRSQLPDGIERLVRVASLGRSLGMHVIACTQNPLGQVNADMKANMSLNICLRVRDGLQSSELIGSTCAASISPSLPGTAYCADGESVTAIRCCPPTNIDAMVNAIIRATDFHRQSPAEPLFTAPLPREILSPHDMVRYGVHFAEDQLFSPTDLTDSHNDNGDQRDDHADTCSGMHAGDECTCSATDECVCPVVRQKERIGSHAVSINDRANNDYANCAVLFGLVDDGVRLHAAYLPIGKGNIAIIGRVGAGKSTLIKVLATTLRNHDGISVQLTCRDGGGYKTTRLRTQQHRRHEYEASAAAPATTEPNSSNSTNRVNEIGERGERGETRETRETAVDPESQYNAATPPSSPHLVWLCDDAEDLLDPFADDATHQRFRNAINNPSITMIMAVEDSRRIRDPARYAARVVFPTGDRATDLMEGIPADLLPWIGEGSSGIAGRGVLIQSGHAMPVQCLKYGL